VWRDALMAAILKGRTGPEAVPHYSVDAA
jgi:hypothetical protein